MHRTSQAQSTMAALCFVLAVGCSSDAAVAPDEAFAVYKIAGDRQLGIAGLPLPIPLYFRVFNTYRVAANAAITFEVIGGGSVDAGNARTDNWGNAVVRWTLGDSDGENQLTVRVAGAEPVTFTATATAVAPENRYYHTVPTGQSIIGLTTDGRFVSVNPGGCSCEGEYQVIGSTIDFVVITEDPAKCIALPALTASIDDTTIAFKLASYDEWDNYVDELLVYERGAP